MDLEMLARRARIQDVIARYFRGIDSGSKALVRSCFTEDAQVLYDGRAPEPGIDAVIGSLRTFKRIANGEMQLTVHFMGNFNLIRLDSDLPHGPYVPGASLRSFVGASWQAACSGGDVSVTSGGSSERPYGG